MQPPFSDPSYLAATTAAVYEAMVTGTVLGTEAPLEHQREAGWKEDEPWSYRVYTYVPSHFPTLGTEWLVTYDLGHILSLLGFVGSICAVGLVHRPGCLAL